MKIKLRLMKVPRTTVMTVRVLIIIRHDFVEASKRQYEEGYDGERYFC